MIRVRPNPRSSSDVSRTVASSTALIPRKITDHGRQGEDFTARLRERVALLKDDPGMRADFVKEMERFLPSSLVGETVGKEEFWEYLTDTVKAESNRAMTVV